MNNFMLRRRAALDPPRFQGWGRRRRYFEGWYFKVVMPEHRLAYAFIPGISYDDGGKGHAFLQVLDGVQATSQYFEYPVDDFQPRTDRFSLQLGVHHFSDRGLWVDLPDLRVDLQFTDIHPWPRRPLAPGVMGWYGFVPRMQCYHGLVSLHHKLSGEITVKGQRYSAEGGVGYTEKDWGSGFPKAWIWCQSNHLSNTNQPASLMASVANIPWMGSSFTGFLSTFLFEGELFTFTTWTGARAQVQSLSNGAVELAFSDKNHRLELRGHPVPGGNLASPIAGAMTGKINESLQARLDVRLFSGGQLRYEGNANWAGLEVTDNSDLLLE
jgi:tocopherol cyclase